jgi:hypothetical protein
MAKPDHLEIILQATTSGTDGGGSILMPYKAFISYSHAADGKLAPALQFALHRFARRWYALPAIGFRDRVGLSLIAS